MPLLLFLMQINFQMPKLVEMEVHYFHLTSQ